MHKRWILAWKDVNFGDPVQLNKAKLNNKRIMFIGFYLYIKKLGKWKENKNSGFPETRDVIIGQSFKC